jgi:hypothetical protein
MSVLLIIRKLWGKSGHVRFSVWPNLNVLLDPLLSHDACIWSTWIEIVIGLSRYSSPCSKAVRIPFEN